MTRAASRLLNKPLANLHQIPHNANLEKSVGELQAVIQRATLVTAYLEHRYLTGCGDQGHDDSCKAANKALTGVRKALGYSIPSAGYRL